MLFTPGKTFGYEFQLEKHGTFMYHLHADEMVQMAMGMMGTFIVHPEDPGVMQVDRDFAFIMSAYDIDPGSFTLRVNEMTDFNMWMWNARVFPGTDSLPVRAGDRVYGEPSGRLGVSLPQVPSHDERDGPSGTEPDRSAAERPRATHQQAGARLRDPEWFRHPKGTVACEYTREMPED